MHHRGEFSYITGDEDFAMHCHERGNHSQTWKRKDQIVLRCHYLAGELDRPMHLERSAIFYQAWSRSGLPDAVAIVKYRVSPTGSARDVEAVQGPPLLVEACSEFLRARDLPVGESYDEHAYKLQRCAIKKKAGAIDQPLGPDAKEPASQDSLDQPLETIFLPPTQYPPEARTAHLEGKARVVFLVTPRGLPKILRASGMSPFKEACRSAVQQTVFHPPTVNGNAVYVKASKVCSFIAAVHEQ